MAVTTRLDELFGLGYDANDHDDEKYDAVTVEQTRDMTAKYFQPASCVVAARDKYGSTPLMKAARRNKYPEVIEALLKAGANAKAKDKKGKTAVDHAKDNEKIYKTKLYWKLNELQYE